MGRGSQAEGMTEAKDPEQKQVGVSESPVARKRGAGSVLECGCF
jgi:hypothetical protein